MLMRTYKTIFYSIYIMVLIFSNGLWCSVNQEKKHLIAQQFRPLIGETHVLKVCSNISSPCYLLESNKYLTPTTLQTILQHYTTHKSYSLLFCKFVNCIYIHTYIYMRVCVCNYIHMSVLLHILVNYRIYN